jgi:murein DD-endopeptidase MepM/ murein hydrolase activator NlpD
VAGAAAVAVAAVGGVSTAEARSATANRKSSDLSLQAVDLDRQLLEVRRNVREQQLRASRDRARKALLARQREEAERKRRELARKKREEELRRLARMYALPLKGFRLSAGFGESSGLWSSMHTGQDFSAPSGTPVRAVAQGVVTSAEWAGPYGWRIIVKHSDGTETWYCHLSSFSVRGGTVKPGEIIGRVGSTGNSTGPHLHFEVRLNDVPLNPLRWLRARGLRI